MVFTHDARIFASVSISLCGTAPFPAGVVASAAPVPSVSRFAAFANAFAIPFCASAVPELDTCTASVANPANEYAAAIVDTSSITTYNDDEKLLVVPAELGQLPSTASRPAAGLACPRGKPGFPPTAYRYTCCPGVQV